uniref:peptide-methionine (R)-S-oxide reductase n=1 Tax=Oncorhynchus tshawytscha TaxID=74940 RepID=A0A8C8G3I6_ONCTS
MSKVLEYRAKTTTRVTVPIHVELTHSSTWPAFSQTIHQDSVSKSPENWGPVKVCCLLCGNGLGHDSSLKFIPQGGNSVCLTSVSRSYPV